MPHGWVVDPATQQPVLQGDDGLVLLKDNGGAIHKVKPENVGAALQDPTAAFSAASPKDIEAVHSENAWKTATIQDKVETAGRQLVKSAADGVTVVPRLGAALAYGAMGKVSPLEHGFSGEDVVSDTIDPLNRAVNKALGGRDETEEQFKERQRQMAEGMPWGLKTAIDVGGFLLPGAGLAKAGEAAELGAKAIGFSEEAAAALGKRAEQLTLEGASEGVGHAASKAAGALGLGEAGAARVGKYAAQGVEGAGIGLTGGTEESWVDKKELTSSAQWAHIGIGGLLGSGTAGALDLIRGAPSAAASVAERVFGKPKTIPKLLEGTTAAAGGDESVNAMARDVIGEEPAPGLPGKLRQALSWVRDRVEQGQSLKTGAPKEALEKFGALRNTPEAIEGQELWLHRPEILKQGATDLTEALGELHSHSKPIYDEVANLELKKGNMRLTGDRDAMMAVGRDKAQEFQAGLEQINQISGKARGGAAVDAEGNAIANDNAQRLGGGRTAFGQGKQVADMKAAYEDVIDGLSAAKTPEEVAVSLDGFKRRMQRVKVNAESSSYKLTSGMEIEQARARASLAQQVSDKTRALLEDSSVWGKFGEDQKATNSAWNRMLSTDQYVQPKIAEITGKLSGGENFGRPQWEMSEQKLWSYLDGLGTSKSKLLDGKLRDNIVSRKELAETIVKSYDLGEHAESLRNVIASSDRAIKLLDRLDKTVAVSNQINAIFDAEAATKGSSVGGALLAQNLGGLIAGAPGAALGTLAHQVLTSPATMIRQAIGLRQMAQRMTGTITKSIGDALSGGIEGAAAMAGAAGERGVAHVGGIVKKAAHEAEERVGVGKYVGETAKEHAKSAILSKLEVEGENDRHTRRAVTASVVETQEQTDRKYQWATTKLQTLAANPSGLSEAIASQVGHIEHGPIQSEMVKRGLTAVNFLASKIPVPTFGGGPVSDDRKQQFLRYYDAVNKPMQIFDDIKNGTATPEQAEALQAVDPPVYAEAQRVVTEKVYQDIASGKSAVSYQARIKLERLFGVTVDPTLKPDFSGFVQSSAQQASQQPKPGGGAPHRSGSKQSSITASLSQGSPQTLHI